MARALRWRLRGLGMEVIAYDPYADEPTVGLDELLERSDVVSLHAPVTPETTGMIGAAAVRRHATRCGLPQLGPVALHDTDACRWPHSGRARCPPPDSTTSKGSPCPPTTRCAAFPSVVLTPHIGGATYDTEANHTRIIAEDLCRLLAGARPLHIVNPDVLGRE